MKKVLTLLVVFCLAFVLGGCEKVGFQKIVLTNKTEDTYTVILDEVNEGVIRAYERRTFNVEKGYHTVRVIQKNGYILYPTDETYYFNVGFGEEVYKSFPEN